jgi:hypothetical protein
VVRVWARGGTQEIERGGERHVVSGGGAHRHGVVVKLVALVVRERRVVRRDGPLELGVRVHGLGVRGVG